MRVATAPASAKLSHSADRQRKGLRWGRRCNHTDLRGLDKYPVVSIFNYGFAGSLWEPFPVNPAPVYFSTVTGGGSIIHDGKSHYQY